MPCRYGGIGRHKGLKIPRSKIRTGSIPVSGTRPTHPVEALLGDCDAHDEYRSTRYLRVCLVVKVIVYGPLAQLVRALGS